jgi:hypothetical protein
MNDLSVTEKGLYHTILEYYTQGQQSLQGKGCWVRPKQHRFWPLLMVGRESFGRLLLQIPNNTWSSGGSSSVLMEILVNAGGASSFSSEEGGWKSCLHLRRWRRKGFIGVPVP